jgi:hypothetical protein
MLAFLCNFFDFQSHNHFSDDFCRSKLSGGGLNANANRRVSPLIPRIGSVDSRIDRYVTKASMRYFRNVILSWPAGNGCDFSALF